MFNKKFIQLFRYYIYVKGTFFMGNTFFFFPSEIGWKVKANDRPYHHLPEFQKKVFLCIKKSRYSVSFTVYLLYHDFVLVKP